MDNLVWERLAAVMEAVADGDVGAVFVLAAEFSGAIAGCLRRHLRHLGVTAIDPDELDGLVLDAVMELRRVAAGWRPEGGALPWVWAGDRMMRVVRDYVGTRAEPIDIRAHDRVPGRLPIADDDDDPSAVSVLMRLASGRSDCRLLLEALERVAPARNRQILLEVRVQASMGDPSPSVTVGRDVGMRPDAVRQVVLRTRRALLDLAGAEPRFATLAGLAIVA